MKFPTRSILKIASIVALVGAAGGAGWPSHESTHESAAAVETPRNSTPLNPAFALKDPYTVLEVRSIFSRDGRAAPVVIRGGLKKPAPTIEPTTRPVFVAPTPDPEASYVLRGVGIQEGVFTAVFEQTSENKGYAKHVGDTVARGRILAMSLDGVDYALAGKPSRILIGQTLEGKVAEVAHSAVAAGGSGDKVSRWIHHDTPAAPATGAPSADANDASRSRTPWGQKDNNSNPWGQKEKNRAEGQGDSNDRQGDRQGERDRDRDRDRNDRQPDMRPGDQGPGGIPDDLPIIPIIIDPN